MIKRHTAYKFWISDILNSDLNLDENGYKYFSIKDKKASRVNIIANVIHLYNSEDNNYVSATLDDGSGQIRLKSWNDDTKLLADISIGDVILVIGRLNFFNGEIYISPEIIKKLNIDWELLRKVELNKIYGQPKPTVQNNKAETKELTLTEAATSNRSIQLREDILKLLKENSDEIAIDDIHDKIKAEESEIEKVIETLLKEGEIYQPKPGVIRLLL